MKIGVPREIKPQENRIGLTPDSVKTLTSNGHEVLVENNGGYEAGFDNGFGIAQAAPLGRQSRSRQQAFSVSFN